jgi:hypothetical protein
VTDVNECGHVLLLSGGHKSETIKISLLSSLSLSLFPSLQRNYHIFYQLAQSAPADLRQMFDIQQPHAYKYLAAAGCITVQGMDDAKEFADVTQAWNDLNFAPQVGSVLFYTAARL